MAAWQIVLLSLAVSFDGLVVGAACAARSIGFGPASLAVIGAASTCTTAVAIAFGRAIAGWLPPAWPGRVGGALLVAAGLLVWQRRARDPSWADRDRSGTIDAREAALIGAALAADAFGAGLAVAVAGLAPSGLPLAVGLAQAALVALGSAGGRLGSLSVKRLPAAELLPALILVGMGVLRVLGRP